MTIDLPATLLVPDRVLVFCDDTDIAQQPVETLQPDLRILVAVQLTSNDYGPLSRRIQSWLKANGAAEFHATDIVSGKGAWSTKSVAERRAALEFIASSFAELLVRVDALWLPKGSYAAYREEAEKLGKVSVGFKSGLRRVFLRCLMERLSREALPAVLVVDQDKTQSNAFVDNSWPEGAFLVGGGPVTAPSHLVPGLQVADMMAWAVNRYLTKRQLFDSGKQSGFDQVALELVASIPGKLTNVLIESLDEAVE
ncbi:DUF3800 domain-containing protein [Rhizobium leguminosarum bv. viciae]|nr:DUF3800 domain-containing protein [Rhizobium leguminosarum bv. viciae]